MKTNQWIEFATKELHTSKIPTARLDALVLLEDTVKKDRTWLLAHPEHEISDIQIRKLSKQIERRQKHEPLAHIRGKTEFYGHEFTINNHVLEPRPESETIIELLVKLNLETPTILDIGTGSGALAICSKLELPTATVTATEIDQQAIKVARRNIKTYGCKISVIQTDLLQEISDSPDVILANLPYVPDNYKINRAAEHEPRIAIFGGKDGLNLYRRMFAQITGKNLQPDYILTESLPFQHDGLEVIANRSHYTLKESKGLVQLFTPA